MESCPRIFFQQFGGLWTVWQRISSLTFTGVRCHGDDDDDDDDDDDVDDDDIDVDDDDDGDVVDDEDDWRCTFVHLHVQCEFKHAFIIVI